VAGWNDADETHSWAAAPDDLTAAVPPMNEPRVARQNAVSLRDKYKEWIQGCHTQYDKLVKLEDRIGCTPRTAHPAPRTPHPSQLT
jgi:hypothetical protein